MKKQWPDWERGHGDAWDLYDQKEVAGSMGSNNRSHQVILKLERTQTFRSHRFGSYMLLCSRDQISLKTVGFWFPQGGFSVNTSEFMKWDLFISGEMAVVLRTARNKILVLRNKILRFYFSNEALNSQLFGDTQFLGANDMVLSEKWSCSIM